jgi:hypothetical protein
MLQGDADGHKDRWLMLVATLMLVLFGIAFAMYARHHRPVQHSIEQPANNRTYEIKFGARCGVSGIYGPGQSRLDL